jgi:hypothetical protein
MKFRSILFGAAVCAMAAAPAMSETRVTYKSAKSTSSYYQIRGHGSGQRW